MPRKRPLDETGLFDLDRAMQSAVFVDTISKEGIVHGCIGKSCIGGAGKYSTQEPGSAGASNTSWVGFRSFNFTVAGVQLLAGIQDINQRLFQFQRVRKGRRLGARLSQP